MHTHTLHLSDASAHPTPEMQMRFRQIQSDHVPTRGGPRGTKMHIIGHHQTWYTSSHAHTHQPSMHTHTMHSSYAPAHATPEIQPRLWHIQSDPWGLFERAECGFTGSQSGHKATKSAVGVGDAWPISTACLCKLCRLATYLNLPESPDLCVPGGVSGDAAGVGEGGSEEPEQG
jgi:hypothetical protein